ERLDDTVRDRLRRDVVVADGRQETVEVDVRHRCDLGLDHVRVPDALQRQALPAQLLGELFSARLDGIETTLAGEPLADLVARSWRRDELQPVSRRARRLDLRREDLAGVTAAQLVIERNEAPVDLGADAGVADLGVRR